MSASTNPLSLKSAHPSLREEVLGGRTASQTSALFLLIETLSVHLPADSHPTAAPYRPTPTHREQALWYNRPAAPVDVED